jgi:pilus assembly protein Flp/PilA
MIREVGREDEMSRFTTIRAGFAFLCRRFLHDKSAATAIEYGLMASLIALIIIGGITKIGTRLSAKFNAIAANLS